MWSGVAHDNIEKAVRAEQEATTTVVLRDTGDFNDAPRRLARVALKILRHLFLDHDRGDHVILKDLIFEIVLSILTEPRVKGHVEQSVGPAVAKDFVSEVGEDGSFFP